MLFRSVYDLWHELTVRHTSALLAEDLLAQQVCMTAVLSTVTQDLKVHPAQWERSTPVAAEPRDPGTLSP